jgi:hypothetical protein
MSKDWRHFLFIRLPLALMTFAIVCQIAAVALSRVPMRRNRSDDLAIAVMQDRSQHRVVLFGDSITRDSTTRFALGENPGEVVNLSTTAALGVAGAYFILQRYLGSHPPPEYVVLSFSPEVYFGFATTEQIHHYLWYTFARPEEHSLLKAYLPDVDRRDSYPVAMNLGEIIVDRFYGVLRRSAPTLPEPQTIPDPSRSVEPASANLASADMIANRIAAGSSAPLRSLEGASLAEICRLVARDNIRLEVIWPPAPKAVAQGFIKDHVYERLQDEMSAILGKGGCEANYFNMNSTHDYGNFRLDGVHVLGEAWEERVAVHYRDYLMHLPLRGALQNPKSGRGTPHLLSRSR